MTCPECQGKTKVLENRSAPHGQRRRRECPTCGYRFTTYEVVVVQIVEQRARVDVDVPDAAELASEIVSEIGDMIDDRLAALPDDVLEALLAEEERRSLGTSMNGGRLALPAGDEEDDDD